MKLRLPWQKKAKKLDLIENVHTDQHALRFGPTHWRASRYGETFRTCSYCGSINPVDLVRKPEWFASWADRKYGYPHKFYVEGFANADPDRLFVLGTAYNTDMPSRGVDGGIEWHRTSKLPAHLRKVAKSEGYLDRVKLGMREPEWLGFGKRALLFAKFYTEHFKDTRISDEVKDAIMRRSGLWIEFDADGPGSVAWHNYWSHFPEKDPGLEARIQACTVAHLAHRFPYSKCPCGWHVTEENMKDWAPEPPPIPSLD